MPRWSRSALSPMKQVVQNNRSGSLEVQDIPPPALRPGGVIVSTAFSLISAGTERTSVETARSSLLGKARSRPDLVKQVIDTFRREGLVSTYQKVKSKLDQVKALGYSASGIVLEVGEGVRDLAVGDSVACAGAGYASHAEMNFVPANLCARVPDGVSLLSACYTTVGAIALQGIRQADVRLGETVAVIGLGLVGQLTVQLLKAGGCRVIGIDPDAATRAQAKESGADAVASGGTEAESICSALTFGRGADAVLITAGTSSNEPIELAGNLARDRATVVVVGAVGLDVPRNIYYHKELNLKLSRSYGPGRYDPSYEEGGVDYPIGYVRWTERRNMEAFLDLVREGKVKPESLTTHRYTIDLAARAYELILGKGDQNGSDSSKDGAVPANVESGKPGYRCGVVLEYPGAGQPLSRTLAAARHSAGPSKDKLGIGFIGAGGFARGVLLPVLARSTEVSLTGVATATGVSSKNTAEQFKFQYAASAYDELLEDQSTDSVFIATRHDTHHSLTAAALDRGKSVFVEKPLAISEDGLRGVVKSAQKSDKLLFVGYNRRFAPIAREVRSMFANRNSAMSIIYRINAGQMPLDHWTINPNEGGGRVIGEVCHFVDFVQFMTGALPIRVFAEAPPDRGSAGFVDDSVIANLGMSDGSVASIIYAASGDKGVAKERVEIFCDKSVATIDDFKTGEFARGKRTKLGDGKQEKGHAEEVAAFIAAARGTAPNPFTIESLAATSLTTFAIIESVRTAKAVAIDIANVLAQPDHV